MESPTPKPMRDVIPCAQRARAIHQGAPRTADQAPDRYALISP